MTSSADLGGRTGFGKIPGIDDDVPFHADWERSVLALTLAMGAAGKWNIDMSRAARERLPREQYLGSRYYEIWIAALEALLIEKGLASATEIQAGISDSVAQPVPVLVSADVASVLAKGSPYQREAARPARFDIGDSVRTLPQDHGGHTRLPSYLAGQTGTVETVYGAHVFPDSSAAGTGENPQWLYRVHFSATAAEAGQEPSMSVSADLWEPYLELA